ncbi:MAG: antitoxin component YwqK of YwqJK toxin-antitoxin module [Parvicella sp.]|jgi:antitoxin component YwqK of YwqJK toxin-antitoxin module
MKWLIFIITIILNLSSLSQKDTARTYYDSGELRSIHISEKDKISSEAQYFYPNNIQKASVYVSKRKIIQKNFNPSGIISSTAIKKGDKFYQIKKFNENGHLIQVEVTKENSKEIKKWHPNGKLHSKEFHKNGEPVVCSNIQELIKGDTIIRSSCNCGNVLVTWKESFYVNSQGQQINNNYTMKRIEYYSNGRIKFHSIQKGSTLVSKEWDINQNLISFTTTDIKVTHYYESKLGGVSVAIKKL